jgi:membrane-associated phospholipid phosphatase
VTGQRFEDTVLGGAQHSADRTELKTATWILDRITGYSVAVAVAGVLAIGFARRRPALAVAGAGVIIASVVATELLQLVLLRPILLPSGVRREDQSFPSGHTTIAMSVMCGLVLVVPYRFRGVVILLGSLWAAGIGAVTVVASWHRPSDTLGSDLIVLIFAGAAIALLARRGLVHEARPRTRIGRVARCLLACVSGVQAVAALTVSVIVGRTVLSGLAGSADPSDALSASAFTAGRALALAGGALVALTLLALLRGVELTGRPLD